MTGAAYSWTFPTTPVPETESIENLAIRGANNDLFYFFYSTTYDWLAHNVSEQSGYTISGTPVGWLHKSGLLFDQYIAAVGENGSLLVFYLQFGKGWVATNVSTKTGYKLTGALTWWETMNGSDIVDHLAGQSTNGDLIVFYRIAKGEWNAVNVTSKTGKKIAGSAVSWKSMNGTDAVEHLAAQSPTGDLLVFYWQPDSDWKVINVTAITGHKIDTTPTSWQSQNGDQTVEHLAAKSPTGDLLVFYWQPGTDWKVVNVSTITGQKIDSSATSWLTRNGDQTVEHLAAKGTDGNLYVFYWQPGVEWKVIDVTAKTGHKIESAPTSWISYNGKQPVEHLAATDGIGNLLVFYWMPWTDWQVVDVSLKASSRVMYAGAPYGGVWKSNDYGNNWFQLTRPQPEWNGSTKGALGSPTILDILVSPKDPKLVFAVVEDSTRITSKGGIYRSTDGGKFWTRVYPTESMDTRGIRVTQIRFAPDDPTILYAAVGKGVAVGKNSGKEWELKKTNGAVWHIAIGPKEQDGARKLYACGNNRLFYSPDSGIKWLEEYAIGKQSYLDEGQVWVCPGPVAGKGTAAQIMEVEPGHSDHLYIAYWMLANGPRYFASETAPDKSHIIFTEMEGVQCNRTVTLTAEHQQKLGVSTWKVACGESSIWFGDFSKFQEGTISTQSALWHHMPGPPVYYGVSTPSGRTYLRVHPIPGGYLLFFGDRSHVHVSVGKPTEGGWHRLDGYDIADTWKDYKEGKDDLYNRLVMHVDPHDIYVSADFGFSLRTPEGIASPYDKSKEIDECFGGRIWAGNDGGIYRSFNCGKTWENSYSGPNTLFPVNIAGLALPGKAPALYIGTGDNDDFMTLDGGKTWSSPSGGCGDCGDWFADPANNTRVTEFGAPGRKGQAFFIYTNPSSDYPDTLNANNTTVFEYGDGAASNCVEGSRPLILSQPGDGAYEVVPKYGDITIIREVDSTPYLLRGFSNLLPSITLWMSVGKALPASCYPCTRHQASGNYNAPTYYVGDGYGLWKSIYDDKNNVKNWQRIASGKNKAIRFFVNPYNPDTIYIIGINGIQRSDDGGTTWNPDANLTNALTVNGEYSTKCQCGCACDGRHCILNDMLFYREDSKKRFAAGVGGVFYSPDGTTWLRLLDPVALPCLPQSLYFDALSNPKEKALYVTCFGRGVLKIYPIP